MRAILAVLLVLPAVLGQLNLRPQACPALSTSCVGEGQVCQGDIYSPSGLALCNPAVHSTCAVCNSLDLICHDGLCRRASQLIQQPCNQRNHQFCDYSAFCNTSNPTAPLCDKLSPITTRFKAAQETCENSASCLGFNLDCNADKLCEMKINVLTTSKSCSADYDCQYGTYCNYTAGRVDNQCATRDPPISSVPVGQSSKLERTGKQCFNFGDSTSVECGHLYTCAPIDLTATPRYECIKPFTRAEGDICGTDSHCAKGLLCRNSFCQGPDHSHAGANCETDLQCGRGYVCGCPASRTQEGTARCVLGADYQEALLQYQSWGKYLVPLYTCLENFQCQSRSLSTLDGRDLPVSSPTGAQVAHQSCGYQFCREHLRKLPIFTPSAMVRSSSPWTSIDFTVIPTRPRTLSRTREDAISCGDINNFGQFGIQMN